MERRDGVEAGLCRVRRLEVKDMMLAKSRDGDTSRLVFSKSRIVFYVEEKRSAGPFRA